MKEHDVRPFPQRHPQLTLGILVLTLLSLFTPVVAIRSAVIASASGGPRLDSPMNGWWVLSLAFPLALIVVLIAAWRRRGGDHPEWVCGRCGYDRRGVPDLSPCPECGAPTTDD